MPTGSATVDSSYPELMKKAASQTDEIDLVEVPEADEPLSTNLFAIFGGTVSNRRNSCDCNVGVRQKWIRVVASHACTV